MNNTLVFGDYLVFIIYFVIVASYGYWIYRRKKKAIYTRCNKGRGKAGILNTNLNCYEQTYS